MAKRVPFEKRLMSIVRKIELEKKLTKFEERFMQKFRPRISPKEKANRKQLWDAQDAADLELAKSMSENLFVGLPRDLLDFRTFFRKLPSVSEKERRFIYRNCKSIVKATQPHSYTLANYGLTVIDIFRAINAVESMIERCLRRQLFVGPAILHVPSQNVVNARPEPLNGTILAEEIYRFITDHTMAKDEKLAAALMLYWLTKAAFYKPRIFRRLVAVASKESSDGPIHITLDTSDDDSDNFALRWKETRSTQHPAQ